MVWYVCSVCTRKLAHFGEKDILQCATKWMPKAQSPLPYGESTYGKGEGDKKHVFGDSP